jgi:transcriptional regulator with XRE-family HTH domain
MSTPLSTELRRLREEKGVSQREVALAVGVQRPTVAQWERDLNRPSAKRIGYLDAYFGTGGELLRLAGLESDEAGATAAAGWPTTTLAEVFDVVGSRLVHAVRRDPNDPECVGWAQSIDDERRPSPWSTALAVRTLLLLDRVDVDMRQIARTMSRRQHAGGWSNRELDVPRPDVTAVVLGTLTRVGRSGTADLEAAWTWLSESMGAADRRRTFVLSTVLENLAQLRPDHPFVEELVRLLLDARMNDGTLPAWASVAAANPHLVQPSVAHTARAVVALRTANAGLGRPEAEDAIGQAAEWLCVERNDDGITESVRVNPNRRDLDVSVDHFTSAHVVRALVGQPGVPEDRLAGAFATLWKSYAPTEGLWAWKADGRLPIWMSHDAVAALRAAALVGFGVPLTPQT